MFSSTIFGVNPIFSIRGPEHIYSYRLSTEETKTGAVRGEARKGLHPPWALVVYDVELSCSHENPLNPENVKRNESNFQLPISKKYIYDDLTTFLLLGVYEAGWNQDNSFPYRYLTTYNNKIPQYARFFIALYIISKGN